jgi:hypothetical protein
VSAGNLPAAAQRFIDATNTEDRAALIGAFTPTGTVDDFGRTFTGPGEIGAWSDRENIGTHNRITVQRVTETDELILADITVTGAGYNGGGVFAFQLDGNLIQGLTIRG